MHALRSLLLSLALVGQAAGDGLVDFRNGGITFTTPGDRLIYAIPGVPLVGTNYVAQLYFGPAPQDLRAVAAPPARFRSPTSSSAGTWLSPPTVGTTRKLPGFEPGDTVWLQVR